MVEEERSQEQGSAESDTPKEKSIPVKSTPTHLTLRVGEDESVAMHYIKVNDVRFSIFQHQCGAVSMNVHGAADFKRTQFDITMHGAKCSKKMKSYNGSKWTQIKVIE